jgi:hypothetical protein
MNNLLIPCPVFADSGQVGWTWGEPIPFYNQKGLTCCWGEIKMPSFLTLSCLNNDEMGLKTESG